jgi:hypothetical protein
VSARICISSSTPLKRPWSEFAKAQLQCTKAYRGGPAPVPVKTAAGVCERAEGVFLRVWSFDAMMQMNLNFLEPPVVGFENTPPVLDVY